VGSLAMAATRSARASASSNSLLLYSGANTESPAPGASGVSLYPTSFHNQGLPLLGSGNVESKGVKEGAGVGSLAMAATRSARASASSNSLLLYSGANTESPAPGARGSSLYPNSFHNRAISSSTREESPGFAVPLAFSCLRRKDKAMSSSRSLASNFRLLAASEDDSVDDSCPSNLAACRL